MGRPLVEIVAGRRDRHLPLHSAPSTHPTSPARKSYDALKPAPRSVERDGAADADEPPLGRLRGGEAEERPVDRVDPGRRRARSARGGR